MYTSPTTKDLKKSHSPRCVGRAEMGAGVIRTRYCVDRHKDAWRVDSSRLGWSYIYVWWVKIERDTLGSKRSRPQATQRSPEFQRWEDKASQLLAVKISGGWGVRSNCQFLWSVHSKGPHGPSTNPPTLGVITRAAARRASVSCGNWVK